MAGNAQRKIAAERESPEKQLRWFEAPADLPDRARFSITYLALFGSVLGFFWYYFLLARVSAVKVNLITLVTPVTALLFCSLGL